MTIQDIRTRLGTGAEGLPQIIRGLVDDIGKRDPGPRGLASVLRLDPDAVQSAEQASRELASGTRRSPLHGIPVLIKDNIDTTDLGCSAGSVLLADVPVEQDAPIVRHLKDAGAIILGKTNLSEWANFRSTRSNSGWSSAGGQTRNAIDPDRTPCGSSSGSATAVKAGFAPIAVGTETDGSILCPAAMQGLVGFRPSVGRVPSAGIVPIASSQDTAGPIASCVTDAWLLQCVLEGRLDDIPLPPEPDAGGLRLGVFDTSDKLHPRARECFLFAIHQLESAGVQLIQLSTSIPSAEIEEAEWIILGYEFRIELESYLKTFRPRSPFRTLEDLHAANLARRDVTMPFFGQEIWDLILEGKIFTREAYVGARETIERLARRDVLDPWFSGQAVTAVLYPANGPATLIDHVNGDWYQGGTVPPGAVAGYPAMTIPIGSVSGLPVGLGIQGGRGGDESVFSVARLAERIISPSAL